MRAKPRMPVDSNGRDYILHAPHPGPQHLFLLLDDWIEVFYGGAAGGGKSDALLMAALQYADVPGYAALLLRRTFSDLAQPGALMERLGGWLADTDATRKGAGVRWEFPKGGAIVFGHVNHHAAVENYASAEYQFIGIDELSRGWERRTYEFLFSRIRKPTMACLACRTPLDRGPNRGWGHRRPDEAADRGCTVPIPDERVVKNHPAASDGTTLFDVPLRMRTSSNPGGSGHKWVKELFVDPETRRPESVYVPAKLSDNPSLDFDEYSSSLSHLGVVERRRLMEGDWTVVEEGVLLKRWWFSVVDEAPADVEWVRYWDFAASSEPKDGSDPDYTAGALVGLNKETGKWYLGDMQRFRGSPLEVERRLQQTAQIDGLGVKVYIEEVNAGDKHMISHYQRNVLPGYPVEGDRPKGGKTERARPLASVAEAGNFSLVKGAWMETFFDEVDIFPVAGHDDQIDATTGGMRRLSNFDGRKRVRILA